MISQLLQMAFFGGLVTTFVGKAFLPPAASAFMSENPVLMFGGLFGCNIMAGKLMSTNAFEMSYNGTPIWSKLETGRFPALPELSGIIRKSAATTPSLTNEKARPNAAQPEKLQLKDEF